MSFPGPSKDIIVEEGLILIMLRKESAFVIFTTVAQNRRYLRKWLPFLDNNWKVEDTEAFINSIHEASFPKRDIVYEIWCKGNFAGLIALKEVDLWNKRTELGYWLDPGFEGQGIMSKCCAVVLNQAFNKMGMHRVQIKTGIGNARSAR